MTGGGRTRAHDDRPRLIPCDAGGRNTSNPLRFLRIGPGGLIQSRATRDFADLWMEEVRKGGRRPLIGTEAVKTRSLSPSGWGRAKVACHPSTTRGLGKSAGWHCWLAHQCGLAEAVTALVGKPTVPPARTRGSALLVPSPLVGEG